MVGKEHSTSEVYDLLQDFFGFVKTQFENTEKRFGGIDQRFERIDQRFDAITVDIKDLKKGQVVIEKDIQAIREDVSGISGAIFELAEKYEDHELRIEKLEGVKL